MVDQDLQQLLASVIANPDADKPRQDYAEHLRSMGQIDRAKFIDLQLEIEQRERGEDEDGLLRILQSEAHEITQTHGKEFSSKEIPQEIRGRIGYNRGFIEIVGVTFPQLISYGSEIVRYAPVRHLVIEPSNDSSVTSNFDLPCLREIRSLDFSFGILNDVDVDELSNSNYLSELRWLSLANCQITENSLKSLANSEKLPQLQWVGLAGTRVDYNERVEYVEWNRRIISRYMLRKATEFETDINKKLKWLRLPSEAQTLRDIPPDRFTCGNDFQNYQKYL